MGLFDGFMGNASKVDATKLADEFEPILAKGEQIEHAYKLIRDLFVFTNKRLILVDKQGLTGKKIEYKSILYNKVVSFSVETAGHFDYDAELVIWVSGLPEPIRKQFSKQVSIYEVQAVLAAYVS
jgi:hypothetical protein